MSTSSDLRVPGDRTGPEAPTGPSGWQSDPWNRHHSRFFDGHRWTEHVADGGIASVDTTPVADLPRSRPVPPDEAPPDGAGPRVLDAEADAADQGLAEALLLVDLVPDASGARSLRTPGGTEVGRISTPRASLPTRLGRRLVSAPGQTPTRLVVSDVAGAPLVRLTRPGRRTAAVVDVTGPDGAIGTIRAESLRQGLRAQVVGADDRPCGRLEQVGPDTASLRVVADEGEDVLARLTPIWDIPGSRQHLPPGVVLVDRRGPDDAPVDPARRALLLAALLAPLLLLPPGPPTDR